MYDARGIESLISHQHRNAMARDLGKRLERWYRRVRLGCFRLRALDVERRREPDAFTGGHEAQRLVLRSRNRAHGLELAQCPNERKVVRCNIGQHEKARAARGIFDCDRIGCSRLRTCPKAPEQVDFPRGGDTDLSRPRIRRFGDEVLEGSIVSRRVIEAVGADDHSRQEPRPADRFSGSRGAHGSAAMRISRFSCSARLTRSDSTGSP
jgi:hypothetical protein